MPIIDVQGVSMRFVRRDRRTGWDALAQAWGRRPPDVWALRDVDLHVEKGEVVGIVGANGAGKSTLLRLMARTLRPTRGTVNIHGRTAALLTLGAGFKPMLSGRENLHLNAAVFGMSRRQALDLEEEIIAFSELEDFIDMPVEHYSSGMRARLGFSVAAHAGADILILDEVLAVGDAQFKRKCRERIREWTEGDHTVVLAQHSSEAIRRMCDRAVYLEKGRIGLIGEPDEVLGEAERRMEALAKARRNRGSKALQPKTSA